MLTALGLTTSPLAPPPVAPTTEDGNGEGIGVCSAIFPSAVTEKKDSIALLKCRWTKTEFNRRLSSSIPHTIERSR